MCCHSFTPWALVIISFFFFYMQHINGSRPPPHFVYDPSIFAFRSLSTLKPLSPIAPVEDPSCAYWTCTQKSQESSYQSAAPGTWRAHILNRYQDPWYQEIGVLSLVCFTCHYNFWRLSERKCMCIEQARHICCDAIIKILLIHRRQVSYKWSKHIILITDLQWVGVLSQTWLISEAKLGKACM